jgi:solute carrier family 35 protein
MSLHSISPSAPKPLLTSFLVCVFYGTTSGALAMMMKSLLSGFNFQGFFIILGAQYGLQLAICLLTRDLMGNPLSVPLYDRAVHMRALRMGVLGVANVGAGLVALRLVNVPMFLCIRRLVGPFILGYEFAVLGKVAPFGVNASVLGILLGTLLAGWDSLSVDTVGYAVTCLNNLLSAAVRKEAHLAHLTQSRASPPIFLPPLPPNSRPPALLRQFSVVMKQFSEEHKATGEGTAIGTLYYNSLTVFPLALFLAAATGEVGYLRHFRPAGDPGFWLAFALVAAMGPLITYSTTLCTTYNSPLTTSITGNVKDIAVTVAGAVVFPGFAATATSVSGLVLSFAGALGYAVNSLRAAQRGKADAEAAAVARSDAAQTSAPGGGDEEDERLMQRGSKV